MSIIDIQNDDGDKGYAEGITAFTTERGLDIILRTSAGESKGRLSELTPEGTLTGSMYEPGAAENAKPITLTMTPVNDDELVIACGNRTWTLTRPKGKSHFFAFLNQWPAKAAPVDGIKAMLAALRKKP